MEKMTVNQFIKIYNEMIEKLEPGEYRSLKEAIKKAKEIGLIKRKFIFWR